MKIKLRSPCAEKRRFDLLILFVFALIEEKQRSAHPHGIRSKKRPIAIDTCVLLRECAPMTGHLPEKVPRAADVILSASPR